MAPPDFLVAGHIVKDIAGNSWQPGGSVLYAAAQAHKLGLHVGAVTVCSQDVEPAAILPGVDWRLRLDAESTSFDNRYVGGHREQRVLATAQPISLDDIPAAWRSTPIILLAPVCHDVAPSLPRSLAGSDSIVGLAAQGWLRRLDGQRVLPGVIEERPGWLAGDVVFVSEEDVEDADRVAAWRKHLPVVVLTRAHNGCSVWDKDGRHDLPAHQTDAIDPTGAGDVFAAAFLIRYRETGAAPDAARFATAAAAISVRGPGISAIGDRRAIEALLASPEPSRAR